MHKQCLHTNPPPPISTPSQTPINIAWAILSSSDMKTVSCFDTVSFHVFAQKLHVYPLNIGFYRIPESPFVSGISKLYRLGTKIDEKFSYSTILRQWQAQQFQPVSWHAPRLRDCGDGNLPKASRLSKLIQNVEVLRWEFVPAKKCQTLHPVWRIFGRWKDSKKCWWICEYACEALQSLFFSEMPPPVSMVLCLKHPGTKGTVGRASLPTCRGVKPQEIGGISPKKTRHMCGFPPLDGIVLYVVVWIDVQVMFEPASIRWKDPIWLICFNCVETIHARCGHFATSFPSWGSEGTWIVPLTPWFLLIIRGVPLICYNLCAVVCMDVGIW